MKPPKDRHPPQKRNPPTEFVVCRWWRASRYELRRGWIAPAPDATFEPVDPWADYLKGEETTDTSHLPHYDLLNRCAATWDLMPEADRPENATHIGEGWWVDTKSRSLFGRPVQSKDRKPVRENVLQARLALDPRTSMGIPRRLPPTQE